MDTLILERDAPPPLGTILGKIEILIAFVQMYATLLELEPFPADWIDLTKWALVINLTFEFEALQVPYRRYVIFGGVMFVPLVLAVVYRGVGDNGPRGMAWWRRTCVEKPWKTSFKVTLIAIVAGM